MDQTRISDIASKTESLLFLSGEPLDVARIAELLSADVGEVEAALKTVAERCAAPESGIRLIRNGESAELVTKAENADVVGSLVAADREETLGKATMETLAVVAYRGPVTRAGIDAIRGVNSSFALRNLLLRGLIERRPNPFDAREYEYVPAFRMLETLGIGSVEELPEYASLRFDSRLGSAEKDDGEETSASPAPEAPTDVPGVVEVRKSDIDERS
ncbi:MAG: SMC-Scp complex subunit ScpB [Candidatus Moranbacteria bacterium]|nr:SMC-Scp complex subunit ScpB [Candidatus Moranbacteria bacterium]NTW45443.1 SMC-Scp complex subunit ScpB [Candidatus Moranbacteria bacterium]